MIHQERLLTYYRRTDCCTHTAHTHILTQFSPGVMWFSAHCKHSRHKWRSSLHAWLDPTYSLRNCWLQGQHTFLSQVCVWGGGQQEELLHVAPGEERRRNYHK